MSKTTKRKLSTSAASNDDAKRARTATEDRSKQSKDASAGRAKTREEPDEEDDVDEAGGGDEDDEDEDDEETDIGENAYPITGPGPHTFLLWADAISCILMGSDEEVPYLVLKRAVADAFAHVADVPKDKQHDAIRKHLGVVRTWLVTYDMESCETPGGKALNDLWEDVSAKEYEKKEEDEEKGEDEEVRGGGMR